MSKDASREFLESMPQLSPGEEFWFACHPEVPCFNACCAGLSMPLTPYDVLRLCQGLGVGSESFIEDYAKPGSYEDSGFPLLHLRMDPTPSHSCPFLTAQGCGVYEHRSSACRTYPLGRATQLGQDDGVAEQYFLVREEHCKGFAEKKSWTIDTWLRDQGMEPYNRMNDRYMRLLARYKSVAAGAILSSRHATMALLCLYQQDKFSDLIRNAGILSRVRLTGEYADRPREALIAAIMENPEERLWFAFDWVELVLFGACANLEPVV